jgi:hypothetical protein
MALTTNLPPQAYTRDTLVKAIEWLSSQPPSVRERATSADLLVSYYLQARRRTVVQSETPVSGENFKADLKHLAEDLKQFEEPSPPHLGRSSSHGPTSFDFLPELPAPTPILPTEPPPPLTVPTGKGWTWTVDARSLAAARELQQRLNLSNEGEALRMLVTLGVERARELLP